MREPAAHEVKPPPTNSEGIATTKGHCDEMNPHAPHFWTLSEFDGSFQGRYYCEGRNG